MIALRFLKSGVWLALAAAPAFAQFTPIATPASAYTSSTTLIPIAAADFATFSSLAGSGQTVTVSVPLQAQTVPAIWSTWGSPPKTESSTPRVGWTTSTTATLTLASPARTFGVEIEPLNSATYTVTVTFLNGSTTVGTISQAVTGDSGALLFAATSIPPITSVVITSGAGSGGFALAQFRFALPPAITSVPAVSTTALWGLGMALLAGGALLARRQSPAL